MGHLTLHLESDTTVMPLLASRPQGVNRNKTDNYPSAPKPYGKCVSTSCNFGLRWGFGVICEAVIVPEQPRSGSLCQAVEN